MDINSVNSFRLFLNLLGKEKKMVTVCKTAIICVTIVAVVYLLMKSGDDKKDKDQKGEE